MPQSTGIRVRRLAEELGINLVGEIVDSEIDLTKTVQPSTQLLLAFGSGVIVPRHVLSEPSLIALNVHAAPPQYPGRDPHHFAVYDRVSRYGATIHYMSEKVDQGPIIDVEYFDVTGFEQPIRLLEMANNAGYKLIQRFLKSYIQSGRPNPSPGLEWGSRVTKRQDFLNLCQITTDISRDELIRRIKATEMPGYNNLFVEIHGVRFRLQAE